jgi:hypothetical protein
MQSSPTSCHLLLLRSKFSPQHTEILTNASLVGKCHLLPHVINKVTRGWRDIWMCIQNFRTGHLERELQMVQLSATRCSCIASLWVSLVMFAAITLCVASQRVYIVVSVYFVIDSVRKLLDTPSYMNKWLPALAEIIWDWMTILNQRFDLVSSWLAIHHIVTLSYVQQTHRLIWLV